MLSYRFHDLSSFQGKSTTIKRPREITQFSFDDQHQCHPLSDASLRYYYPPFLTTPSDREQNIVDLSKGFGDFHKYNAEVDLHLYPLLDTLELHEQHTGVRLDADIVTWRGMMTKILTAPFDQHGEFEMNATCFQGTIFIEENHKFGRQPESNSNRAFRAFSPELAEFWGYKFETLSTLQHPWAESTREAIENRESEVVSNYAQYCSIVRTGIGAHSLILAGEVDAIAGGKPDDPDAPIPYIELKTSQNFGTHDQKAARRFEQKLCRIWAQSFLLGVPKIIIGFRDNNGYLLRLQEWKTLEIPSFVSRQGMRTWDGNVCINFAAGFLDHLKETVVEGTWRIQRKKGAMEILLYRMDHELEIVGQKFTAHRQGMQSTTMAGDGEATLDTT